jgi:hypothetical protein
MGCCAPYQYNDTNFRAQFPAFANQAIYPTATLYQYWCAAGSFIENDQYSWLRGCALPLALNLMTAHLAQLATNIANGNTTPGVETQASIDKISVTQMTPPLTNAWQWYLGQTQYGAQLLALLQAKAVGGFYAPGGWGRAGFGVN